jgi:GT2 family glycosyltransferase
MSTALFEADLSEAPPAAEGRAPPDVSIVVPVFNQCALTRACLAGLERCTTRALRWEVVVVDNGSSDATPAMLQEAQGRCDWLRVIANDANLGFARACNQGARASAAETILFLNNDVEPRPGWLEPMFRTLRFDPRIGAVGSRLLFPDGTIQHAGVYLADHRPAGDPFVAIHNYYRFDENHPQALERRVYPALTAACLLVRRRAFDDAGGFDEGYWNGYEDVDFCLALGERGWLCVYEPQSVLVHHESQSGPERFRKAGDNVRRLHEKWRSRVRVNCILHDNGETEPVCRDSIRPLALPDDWTFERALRDLRGESPLADAPSRNAFERVNAAAGDPPFNVVLVQPEGYEHAEAFREVGELITASLRSLGRTARMQTNYLDPAAVNVVLGCNLLPSAGNLRLVRHVIVQLEQLSEREGWFRPELLEMLRGAEAVWDYAPENVAFLRARGLTNVSEMPIGYHESLRRISRRPADVDVLFYGSLNARRRAVLEEIGRFADVKCLVGVYGRQRDDYIARSKIVLNLHYYDAQIMEQARIAYLLNNRCFVVSESSPHNPFGEGLVARPYEELAETVRYYLERPEERFARAKAAHHAFRARPMVEVLRPLVEFLAASRKAGECATV